MMKEVTTHGVISNYIDLESHDELMDVYERLEDLGADVAEARASYILHGLGFSKEMVNRKCKDMSGKEYSYILPFHSRSK